MLELKKLTVDITDENGENKRILDDVSFKLADCTFAAITGPNGSGKSTLAKTIMGIMPPTSGEIIFNGKNITQSNIKERSDIGISFAFQQPVRFKGVTVGELISLAAGRTMEQKTLCDYLTAVGLCALDYVNRPADDSLSGGEMKRIEIATILARNTQLSIFDELKQE